MSVLHLNFRELARINIENVELLGAFNGYKDCLYHYDDKHACSIGIADPECVLSGAYGIFSFIGRGIVSTDNDSVVRFIQRLHDTIVNANYSGNLPIWYFYEREREAVPLLVKNLLDGTPVLTKELYLQIMEIIANEPAAQFSDVSRGVLRRLRCLFG